MGYCGEKRMIEFMGPLYLRIPVDEDELGDNLFILDRDFVIQVDGQEIRVPRGFKSDGTSVPGFLPSGIAHPMTGIKASVIHDFCYRTHRLPKDDADSLFDAMLRMDKTVDGGTRLLMVTALNSDPADQIYYREEYVPEIVCQDEEIED